VKYHTLLFVFFSFQLSLRNVTSRGTDLDEGHIEVIPCKQFCAAFLFGVNAKGVVYPLFIKYLFIMKYVIYREIQGLDCGVGDQGSILGRGGRRYVFLILSFRRVLNEVCFLLGVSPASEC
jgi:hypothetical protein